MHFQIQATIIAAWFLTGSRPQVKSFAGRSKASYIGFVTPKTGALFMARAEKFTYITIIEALRAFLGKHPPPEGKKYVIIWDNAPWHKKAMKEIESMEEYADIRESVVFLCLPPYSPDLNPIEQVWRILRRERTHNRFFPNVAALVEAVEGVFPAWSVPNEQLRQLCKFG